MSTQPTTLAELAALRSQVERLRSALERLKAAVEYTPLGVRGLTAVDNARAALLASPAEPETRWAICEKAYDQGVNDAARVVECMGATYDSRTVEAFATEHIAATVRLLRARSRLPQELRTEEQ